MQPYYTDDTVTLYKGDALAVLEKLESGSVDAVITDPPYSSGGQFRGDRTKNTRSKYADTAALHTLADFGGDSRDQRSYQYWCALWLAECLRITKPGGILCQFTDWRQLPATSDAIQAGGWTWRGIIPWIKRTNVRPQLGRFKANAEYVLWGTNGNRELNYKAGGSTWDGYFLAEAPRDREHLTQKPLDVMRHLVQPIPNRGVICDPFMGAGTTGAAAVLEGKRFVGIEHSDEYMPVAARRIRVAAGESLARYDQTAFDFGNEEAI